MKKLQLNVKIIILIVYQMVLNVYLKIIVLNIEIKFHVNQMVKMEYVFLIMKQILVLYLHLVIKLIKIQLHVLKNQKYVNLM